jgi:alpha-L-arabinofuranosidase
MKHLLFSISIAALFSAGTPAGAAVQRICNEPDSVSLFAYTTRADQGRSGLHFAWSPDQKTWLSVADQYAYVSSDYGRWGSQKRMFSPSLVLGTDGRWHATWQVTPSGHDFAYAVSDDLLRWKPQTYYDADDAVKPQFTAGAHTGEPCTIVLNNDTLQGTVTRVPMEVVNRLTAFADHKRARTARFDERTEQDATRFADLKPLKASLKVDGSEAPLPISEHLIGIFFEDINYAADGGLYAELVQNRDFEYAKGENRNPAWDAPYAWTVLQSDGTEQSPVIATENPLHANNSHYVVLPADQGLSLQNSGYEGIPVKKGERYDFSLYGRLPGGSKAAKVKVQLVNVEGQVLAEGKVNVASKDWKQASLSLTANATEGQADLRLVPEGTGDIHLDMISLFPHNTWKGRSNGLRADLAQALADLHPKFVRFPGGCIAHGDGISNIYDWKGSVGALYERKPLYNQWGYHQTRGLGYHEYFQFCEDLGAEPVPVVAAGVPCQNSGRPSYHSHNEITTGGQQGGIPMEDMPQYIQDVLDLIEYANGDARTTEWGKKRAANGHAKPFNLKYIGIGNEDLITDLFKERFTMIYEAVKAKYPDVTVIGTVGPWCEGSDYEEGWEFATQMKLPMVDEHYYNTPGWFIHNRDFYDRYDRNKSKVYLGEYAAHLPGRPNNIETALAEALYLTDVERNADVVTMTSYAPLLAKEGHTQWNPDMIYFNNTEVKPTTDYYAQLMYGQNVGTQYLPAQFALDTKNVDASLRVGSSVVRDEHTGDVIVKMVNLLPVSVDVTADLSAAVPSEQKATVTVLAGAPADKQATPTTEELTVGSEWVRTLPAYSFTVVRIAAAANKKK